MPGGGCHGHVPVARCDRRPCALPRAGHDRQGRYAHREHGGGGRWRNLGAGYAQCGAADNHRAELARAHGDGKGAHACELCLLPGCYQQQSGRNPGNALGAVSRCETLHGKQHGQHAGGQARDVGRALCPFAQTDNVALRGHGTHQCQHGQCT